MIERLFSNFWSNLWLRLLALLIAGLVWLHVATEREYRTNRVFPVGRMITRDGLVATPLPDSLRVVVEATGKELILLETEEASITINAAGYSAGRQVIGIGAEQLLLTGTRSDAKVIRVVSPEFVEISLDRMAHEALPVRAVLNPITDDGFIVGSEVSISPASVTVHAPSALLASLREVSTDSIPLLGLRNEVTLTVPLASPHPEVYRLEPESVQVSLTILATQRLIIDSIPVRLMNVPTGMLSRVTPALLRLELIGPGNVTALPTRRDILARVDAALIDSLRRAAIEVMLPEGWMIAAISAQSATVNMIRETE